MVWKCEYLRKFNSPENLQPFENITSALQRVTNPFTIAASIANRSTRILAVITPKSTAPTMTTFPMVNV